MQSQKEVKSNPKQPNCKKSVQSLKSHGARNGCDSDKILDNDNSSECNGEGNTNSHQMLLLNSCH